MKTKTVRIGAQVYTVEMKPDHVLDGAFGRMSRMHCLIEINEASAKRQQADTLLHEAVHAMFSDAGLNTVFNHEQEETLVAGLTPRLSAFISDNKDVVRELLRVL